MLFVADNADRAGNFPQMSNAVADYFVPAPYTVEKVYYGLTHTSVASANAAIINAINQGRLIVSYVGHANNSWWAHEKIFQVPDLPLLTNSDRLPFFTPMTCLDGYYILPPSSEYDSSSLAESLVRQPSSGAIASFSPSGLGVATGHDYLEKGLFEAIFYNGEQRLGPATTYAKMYLSGSTLAYDELIETYILFGDPASRLSQLSPPTSSRMLYIPILTKNAP